MKTLRRKGSLILSVLVMMIFCSNLVLAETIFTEGFEGGWGGWSADNGVWEVGTPTTGPPSSHGGTQCVATVLSGNYSAYTNSRLVSPSINLPPIGANEEIHFRFYQWFSFGLGYGMPYRPAGSGNIQIMTYDASTGTWSPWTTIGDNVEGSSPAWSLMDVDLTAYANKKVKIGFYLSGGYPDALGWYIDDIVIDRVCTATINENLLLNIPYLYNVNPISESLKLWVELVYDFNPTYPELIIFKLTNYFINNSSFSCAASTLSDDLTIHIPGLLLPDGITHLWLDLEYSPALSTDGNFYWVISDYGAVSN